MVGPEIGYGIGAAGLALAGIREVFAATERRRARPVVIAHEDRARHFAEAGKGSQAVSAHLSNESSASAFNIRFGVILGGVPVGWKHDAQDENASRINVLRPGETTSPMEVVFPMTVLLSTSPSTASEARDIDRDRVYWAVYQSPAGEWWYTLNPARRSDDLTVRRVRSRRWGVLARHERELAKKTTKGEKVLQQVIAEATEYILRGEWRTPRALSSPQRDAEDPPDAAQ